METRARYVLVGLFVLAFAAALFGFVYWLNNAGGWRDRTTYQIQFVSSVSGLRVGAPVLFNGIRVGEVTGLRLSTQTTSDVFATIAVDRDTPVRANTQVDLIFQGLTGTAAVALQGGSTPWPAGLSGNDRLLHADAAAGQDLTQAARQLVGRLDQFVADNADPLKGAIADIRTFAAALARNSSQLDELVGGVVKMTGGAAKPPPTIFDLKAPSVPTMDVKLNQSVTIPDATAIVTLDTQKFLIQDKDGSIKTLEGAQWSDSLPKLVPLRLIESFEAAGLGRWFGRPVDMATPELQLLVEIRQFQILAGDRPEAAVTLNARLVTADGKVKSARMVQRRQAITALEAAPAAAAFNTAFGEAAKDILPWAVEALQAK